jgi:hypothetical protein
VSRRQVDFAISAALFFVLPSFGPLESELTRSIGADARRRVLVELMPHR